jgi:ABC-type sugar transport system substrate-binding protein
MIETLPNGGDIIVVNGVQGATWATGRWDGFQDALADAGYTDRINIVALQWTDSSRAGAQAVFEDMFLANPDIDAVLVCCDQPALGVADVLEEAGQAQGGIPIVTGGGWDEEEKNRIRDGTIRISIVQQPLMDAIQATRMAVVALNGDTIPFFIGSPVVRVDQSNVETVDESFFAHPTDYRIR